MTMHLNPGYYVNMFRILIPKDKIEVMSCDRSKYPNLRDLRNEIKKLGKKVFVYAPEKSRKAYGYGADMNWLTTKHFESEIVDLYETPRLAGRMSLEGIISKALQIGYTFLENKDKNIYEILDRRKGRIIIYNKKPRKTSDENVNIFIGYDLRVVFLRNPIENELNFGLVVDITYSLRDKSNKSLNYKTIVSKYGSDILREIRQIQRDLIPTGINREVSKQRLFEDILPFVENISEIELPCGLKAKIAPEPCRIILGGKDEPLW